MTYEYEVPVWFTIRSKDKAEAEEKIARMLEEMEEYEQIAPWVVDKAVRMPEITPLTNIR
jgi:hypothetical protein